ncbi:unnamed protein product [Danaus chrysippus]|uniref:(African queen) hypothetical protein n=1 Tax=Danaus chrysippus TaxID=151541 RepID=A0A8J2QK71_9NEOP|nr:unnamed protein product [Danaus chrysippus]
MGAFRLDTPLMTLWYKRDGEYQLPKSFVTLDQVSPLAYSDPLDSNRLLNLNIDLGFITPGQHAAVRVFCRTDRS